MPSLCGILLANSKYESTAIQSTRLEEGIRYAFCDIKQAKDCRPDQNCRLSDRCAKNVCHFCRAGVEFSDFAGGSEDLVRRRLRFIAEGRHSLYYARRSQGVVRVVNPYVNLRLTWQPQDWTHASTIQIRTISSGVNTVISFHQEGLPDASERGKMRLRWHQAIAELEKHFPPSK